MNYLKKNLHNSRALPYDIMKLISEYAEPYFLKQIENKDYDLDEIMYKRMIKYINAYYNLYHRISFFDKNDMLNNESYGYRKIFLKEYNSQKICGLYCNPIYHPLQYRKYKMLSDLEHAKIYKNKNMNYDRYKMKNVYKKWLKL